MSNILENNDNDFLNTEDDTTGELNTEELKAYLDLLKLAYPEPHTDIKKAVMEAIASESGSGTKGRKLLPASSELCCALVSDEDRSNVKSGGKKNKIFIKYGALAASVVFVLLAGIKVIPAYLNRTDITAHSAYTEVSDGGQLLKNSSNSIVFESDEEKTVEYGANAAITEENETYGDAAEPEEELADDSGSDENTLMFTYKDEAASDKLYVMESVSAVGGTYYSGYEPLTDCQHSSVFRNSYHDIPAVLRHIVGDEAFNEWAYETESESGGCGVNIRSFYEHFAETDPDFAEEFLTLASLDVMYYCDLPELSLFKEERYDEIDEYYENGGDMESAVKNYFEYKYKTALISSVGVNAYTGWLSKNSLTYMSDWCIAQFAAGFELDSGELEKIYNDTLAKFRNEYPDAEVWSYDFDKLAEAEDIKTTSGSGEGREYDSGFRLEK